MRRLSASILALAAAICAGAQTRAEQVTGGESGSAGEVSVVLMGCLEAGAGGSGFVLKRATPVSQGTTPSAGTSATGEAPSGQVTGQTPTGSTATEAASPTPAVGTPGATANPASPTYNQPAGDPRAVSSTDTPAGSGVTVYRLAAASGVSLEEHAGHTVEVRGRLIPTHQRRAHAEGPATESVGGSPDRSATGAAGTSGAGAAPDAARTDTRAAGTLSVASIRHVAATCRP